MKRGKKCRVVQTHNVRATAEKHVKKVLKTNKNAVSGYVHKTRRRMLPYDVVICYR